ncbi:FAD-binding oxidoreductase [Arthrobacter sp. ISL-5]|uniref:NAD(P)/FAD-dependent oxidoreductase n=1 Tax=Arthrobacter sp. ISL-5 TaxID=2819111 RepID=UPI0020359799|nr:FAD-binding oxidoreductase [Arthrobacter sp. ISL-5]
MSRCPSPSKAPSASTARRIHAVKYLQGLAGAVHGDGSFVFEESPAVALQDGSPTAVNTERGSVRARDVIVATNVPFGDRGVFDARCYPHRSYLTASLAAGRRLDDAFRNSTFIGVDEPMRSILTVDVDGTSYVLTGGEGHRASDVGDAAERYSRLAAFARDRLGAGETAFRWSTQDAMPVDGLPYVGLMSPDARHVHVITGLRKWGLTNGTAAALILADTLCGRHNAWAAVFRWHRHSGAGREEPPAQAAALLSTPDAHVPAKPSEGKVSQYTNVAQSTNKRQRALSRCTLLPRPSRPRLAGKRRSGPVPGSAGIVNL